MSKIMCRCPVGIHCGMCIWWIVILAQVDMSLEGNKTAEMGKENH